MNTKIAPEVLTEEAIQAVKTMSDDELRGLSFAMPWQYDPNTGSNAIPDADGFSNTYNAKDDTSDKRPCLQELCWEKFNRNPFVNTAVRAQVGRMTGLGFETTSGIYDILKVIEEEEEDHRNRLYNYMPKFVARSIVEGELFLIFTLHDNGFVEIDFIDPALIQGGSSDNSGIIFHPEKTMMPLFYNVKTETDTIQIPSIYIARYPKMLKIAEKDQHFDSGLQGGSKSRKNIYKQFHGYKRFIVAWDKGYVTKRAISHLRTTLEWLSFYETLKKYEIDHKKSAGSYLWVFTIEDTRSFRLWASLTPEQRRNTGITAKKTPGGSLILPPGIKLECINPSLSPLRNEDTDIKELVAAGMNEPSDIMTGTSNGTFAAVKETRGPMSDRTSDEIAYFGRFLVHDFWGNIFFLRSSVTNFPKFFDIEDVVGFKGKKEIIKKVKTRPEKLIDISFPISETIDFEGKARGLLGVKHGPVAEQLGISNKTVASFLGLGGYPRLRQLKALEDKIYPELDYSAGVDTESAQEKKIEPKKDENKDNKKQEK